MIKVLIFDLDGTLANTLEAIRHGLNLTMKKYGFPEHSYNDVMKMVGNGAKNLIRYACPEGTFKDDVDDKYLLEIFHEYDAMYSNTYIDTQECYTGIPEALKKFKDSGYKIAILSNKQDLFVKELAKILLPEGIIDYAEGQTNMPIKPDPTTALRIAKRFGVQPSECAFIGDSDVDIKTAKNANMLRK